MSENVQLIRKKIEHLQRMRMYLDYSLAQASPTLNLWFDRIVKFCDLTYPSPATTINK
jgi:hypothetical protein